jgi:hypothetical protein
MTKLSLIAAAVAVWAWPVMADDTATQTQMLLEQILLEQIQEDMESALAPHRSLRPQPRPDYLEAGC